MQFFPPLYLKPFSNFCFLSIKNPKPSEACQVLSSLVPKESISVLSLTLQSLLSPSTPWQFPKSDHTTAACLCLSSFFCLNIRFLPLLLSRNLILSARLKLVNFPRLNSNINSIYKKYSGLSCTLLFLHI